MALDDRIAAAAPGCYLTTFRRLIELAGSGRVKRLDPADVLGRPIGPDRPGEGQTCQREAPLEPPICRVVQQTELFPDN
jgi:hypothetical protein